MISHHERLTMSQHTRPDVSIIVPIYGTESYLSRCLHSILDQSFDNFEIICVDDMSPDHSAEIVSNFALRDPRVRLLRHSRNLGLGGARNTGIRNASADFVMGVDSDDYIHRQMVENLFGEIITSSSDIVECGYAEVTEEGKTLLTYAPTRPSLTVERSTDIFGSTRYSFWNKIFRRDLFETNQIWFPEELFYEDLATIPRLIARARRVSYIDVVRYQYVQRSASITNHIKEKNILDYIRAFDILFEDMVRLGTVDVQQENFKSAVRTNMDFIKRKISLSNDHRKVDFIRYADFVERMYIDSIFADPPHTEATSRVLDRPFRQSRDVDCPPAKVAANVAARPIQHIAFVSAHDETEAIMRMKIGALREWSKECVSFQPYGGASTRADVILVNHLDSLENIFDDLRKFRVGNPNAPIAVFVSDFYPRVPIQVAKFKDIFDCIIVPTREMEISIQHYTDRRVIAIPDPIDFYLKESIAKKHVKTKFLDVVWFGYPESFNKSMLQYSETLEKRHAMRQLRYHIITDTKNFGGVQNALVHHYCPTSFSNQLPLFDLCVLSHLPSDFQISTYFKSENKAILAINRGVPVIASRTPSYERLLDSMGLSDCLFSSASEFERCLDDMQDPVKRNIYLERSQDQVLHRYSYPVVAKQLWDVIENLRKL